MQITGLEAPDVGSQTPGRGPDQAMPPGFWHPGMSARLGPVTLIELDGDHEALLTHLGPLATALTEAASENGPSVDEAPGGKPDQANHK